MEVQKFQTLTELQGSDYPVHIDFLLARGFSKEFRFTVLENGSPWTPSGQWTYELLGIDQTSPMIIKTYPDGGIEYDPETSELVFTISAEEIANFEYNVYGHRLSWIDLSDDIDPTYKLYITGETTIRSGKEIPADLYTINDVKDIVDSDQIETHNLSPRSHPYLLNLILDTQADVVALRTTVESSQADIDSRITELNDNLTATIDANTEELTALINQSNEDLTTLIQSTENDLYQSLSTTSTRLLNLIDTNTKRLDVLGTNFANYQTKTDYTLSVLSSNYNQLSRQHNADVQRLDSKIDSITLEIPELSYDIEADRDSNTKTTTPKAVAQYVDQAVVEVTDLQIIFRVNISYDEEFQYYWDGIQVVKGDIETVHQVLATNPNAFVNVKVYTYTHSNDSEYSFKYSPVDRVDISSDGYADSGSIYGRMDAYDMNYLISWGSDHVPSIDSPIG